MIKIFLDTNIFISGFFFDGNERKIVEHRSKNIKYFTSEQVTDEIESVLLNKFNVDNNTVKKYVAKIILEFVLIKPKYHLNIIVRDEKDTNILKSALAGKCTYLVSGDKDLLTLKQVENTKIITSKQLIDELKL